jgi:hypothetical protein
MGHGLICLRNARRALRVNLNILSLTTQGDAVVASVLLGDGNETWIRASEALNDGSAGQRRARG